jgi:hypothetical protein
MHVEEWGQWLARSLSETVVNGAGREAHLHLLILVPAHLRSGIDKAHPILVDGN